MVIKGDTRSLDNGSYGQKSSLQEMPLDLAPKEAAAHLDLGVPTIRVGSMLSILGPLWGSYVSHIVVPFFFIVPLAFSGVSRLGSFQDVGTVFQNLHGLG